MLIEAILDDPINSYLLFTSGVTAEIVIGVPHHAPLGVSQLPCKEHPDADENAGFLGYYVSQLLDCPCIVACNYFIDSNKDKNSDYFKMIDSVKPKILIEIHGHGSSFAKFDIEISSGSQEKIIWSMAMATKLNNKMKNIPLLRDYSLSGDFSKIYYKAQKSLTITSSDWVAFHIELPKLLRQSKSQYVPFSELLTETANEVLEMVQNESQTKK